MHVDFFSVLAAEMSASQRLPALYEMSRMIVSGLFAPDKSGVPAAVEVESLSLSWECACGARRRTHARAPWPQRAACPTAASGGYPSSFIKPDKLGGKQLLLVPNS